MRSTKTHSVNRRARNLRRKSLTGLVVAAAAFSLHATSADAALVTRTIGVTLNASNLEDYSLDVDQNGTNDFTFQTAYVPDPVLTVGFDQIAFTFGSNNGVVIDKFTGDGFPSTSLLTPGNTISSASLFSGPNDLGNLYSDDTLDPVSGNFNGKTGFVGFRFDGTGGIHYGYAQVTVVSESDPTSPLNLTIGQLVYNDVAGNSVAVTAVPEPAVTLITSGLTFYGLLRRRASKR